ncbi:TPR repeat protein [Aminobacter lissarensis]|uniref:TPR repeat protein n=1 Tax=Aminobacter carboxidus TaxID=376165 RepID=A0A8E1WB96_9HYPH|nr:tetratricopeptide repeat protein [Aminobacter lissarensis]MBB6464450.1 TPR repeat protein [Aminobacter lissarensis]
MSRICQVVLMTVFAAFSAGTAMSAETAPEAGPPTTSGGATSERAVNADALLRLGDLYSNAGNANRDPAKAFDYYRQAADAGSAAARLRVGEMRVLGEGTERDINAGLSIIEEVASAGDGAALASLGGLYSHADSRAIPLDLPRAYDYYRRAAAAGNETGILRSGEMLARGQGIARDREAGLAQIRSLADRGNMHALVSLGDLMNDPDAGALDAGQAETAYAKAAALGHADALLRLADLYGSGRAGKPDYAKAFEFYQKAAEQGQSFGKLRVAELTFRGQGTRQDVEGGLASIKGLADAGDAEALTFLGDVYSGMVQSPVATDAGTGLGYYKRAAEAGNTRAALRAGEMTAHGLGTLRDVSGGRDIVRRFADAGNPQALISLGDLLREPESGDVDGDAALAAYERAASRNEAEALVRLGDFYSDGMTVAVDLAKALDYYRQAAGLGDVIGVVRAGAMLARGQGTAQDVAAGRAMVKAATASGEAEAHVVMGDLLSRGDAGPPDVQAAMREYAEAASLGRTQGLIRLGDLYREGKLLQSNGKKAAGYYRQAAEAGDPYGLLILGSALSESLLRNAGKPADGVAALRQAQATGLDDAVIPLADAMLYGMGTKRDAKAAVALLEQAAGSGNIAAARHLISYYRDGRRYGRTTFIKADPKRAEQLIAGVSPWLSRGDRLVEEMLFAAAGSGRQDYQSIAARIPELSVEQRQSLVRMMRTTHPNGYIYLAQQQLKQAGFYRGPVNGVLSGTTTRAVNRYCAEKSVPNACRFGPMSSQAGDVLSYAF